MKKKFIGMIMFGCLASLSAFANGRVVATCNNGEAIRLRIVQVGPNNYRADIIMQSTGDSYPTFHYDNLQILPQSSMRIGAPVVYQAHDFEIGIQDRAPTLPARLTIADLGIYNTVLRCR